VTVAELADVVTAIEDDIIFGRLTPGQRLVEDGLMTRFSATRHTIRQALGRLERIGIVTREPNVGATVRFYAPQEVLEIYQVREFLQRQAALMIRLPAPSTLIEQLEALNERFSQAGARCELRAVHELNDQFHLAIFGACGNSYLVGSIADYMALSLPMRATSLGNALAFQLSVSQHKTMIRLLRSDDNWALAQLCVEHVWPSKQDYLQRAGAQNAATSAVAAGAGGSRRYRPAALS
jgi:DNA-binding GntR family transcriptional regulator